MLEAELPDGDLSQVTQAVQNALRSPEGGVRRLLISPKAAAASNGVVEQVEEVTEALGEEVVQEEEVSASTGSPRAPRKGKTPTVLELDLTSGTSFAEFARPKNPKSDLKRYLVIAAWFKEHRKEDAITVDHVYSCYRSIEWPAIFQTSANHCAP